MARVKKNTVGDTLTVTRTTNLPAFMQNVSHLSSYSNFDN